MKITQKVVDTPEFVLELTRAELAQIIAGIALTSDKQRDVEAARMNLPIKKDIAYDMYLQLLTILNIKA